MTGPLLPGLAAGFPFLYFLYLSLFFSQEAYTSDGHGPGDSHVSYRRHQVWRVTSQDEQQLADLQQIYANTEGLDLWGDLLLGSPVDILVPPHAANDLQRKLSRHGITKSVQVQDLQNMIDEERAATIDTRRRLRRSRVEAGVDKMLFYWFNVIGRYVRHQEMNDWLELATYASPDLCETIDIGLSGQGRTIKVLRVGAPAAPGLVKPAVWLDGGMHAREWLSPATAAYIIFQLVDKYGSDPNITTLVDSMDWYILPIANPDGYEYSHTVDRLWRKTRSPQAGSGCVGVDINRNFDYHWQNCDSDKPSRCGGAAPCRATFAGPRPFSEPETRHVATWLLTLRDRLKMYLTLHAYAQMWLTPWSHTRTLPDDHQRMMEGARVAVDAIQAENGETYTAGSAANTLYMAGGTGQDWARAVLGVNHSYTLELRDRGRYGFFLPRHLILPAAHEAWAGIKALAFHILLID